METRNLQAGNDSNLVFLDRKMSKINERLIDEYLIIIQTIASSVIRQSKRIDFSLRIAFVVNA